MSDKQQNQQKKKFKSHNSKGEILEVFEQESDDEITQKIQQGDDAFQTYKCQELKSRKEKLIKLAEILEEHAKEDAEIMCEEMGKPFSEAKGEVLKSADHCRYYAGHLEEFLKPQEKNSQNQKQLIYSEPLGVIYIITPFNFPHFQIFKPAIANLALGNAVLVRPASTIPRCGLRIEKRFKEAGFGNMYQNVFASSSQLDVILGNKLVKGVSFTGSTQAGASIAQTAGKYLKKQVMELGGSDPFIVLEDADLKKAVKLAIQGRLKNCGQVCTSSKRFFIHEKIYDEFKNRLVDEVKNLKISYPMQDDVYIGPMAREDLLDTINEQIEKSVEQGGKLIYGGKKLPYKGNFMQPAIIEVTDLNNVILKDETFGPVFPLMRFKNDQEAIELANNTVYALGSSVIGEEEHAVKIAEKIVAGMTFVNNITQSNSALPFGGTKDSGYGRECGEYGFKEFSNKRVLWIA